MGPTVIWQGEFPDEATLRKYEEVADNHPDFLAARKGDGHVHDEEREALLQGSTLMTDPLTGAATIIGLSVAPSQRWIS